MHRFYKDCFHNNPGRFKWSVLHTACAYGQLKAVKMIVQSESDQKLESYDIEKLRNILDACCAAEVGDIQLQAMIKPKIDVSMDHNSGTELKAKKLVRYNKIT